MATIPLIPSIALFLLLFLATYKHIIHPFFLSPLSKIPAAHFTAHISHLWILWKRHQALENQTLLTAHKKLGPVIRLAPDELSVNCVEDGIRTIYSGGFEKHVWYPDLFSNYDGYAVLLFPLQVFAMLINRAQRPCDVLNSAQYTPLAPEAYA